MGQTADGSARSMGLCDDVLCLFSIKHTRTHTLCVYVWCFLRIGDPFFSAVHTEIFCRFPHVRSRDAHKLLSLLFCTMTREQKHNCDKIGTILYKRDVERKGVKTCVCMDSAV